MAVQKNQIDREKSRSPSWLFDCHRSRARNIKKTKKPTACAFLEPKKGAIFSLIYFFESFCIYCIPQNYIISQAMPHAIPQTHSGFYPHRKTAAMLVSQTNPLGVELFSYANYFICYNNLHRCWPRERKHSISTSVL